MVIVFWSRLLREVGVDGDEVEGESDMPIAPTMLSHSPPPCQCPMMKMWAAFASSVPGLVMSALLVSDWMTCLSLVGAWQDMDCFIKK